MRAVVIALSIVVTSSAAAQSLTLSSKRGEPAIVGGGTVLGENLGVTSQSPQQIVAKFKSLCLPDPANADAKILIQQGFTEKPVQLAGPPVSANALTHWVSPVATVAYWRGDTAAFKGQAVAVPSRAALITGPFSAFGPRDTQCTFVTNVADFEQAKLVTEALSADLGTPSKLVVKNTFADGFWATTNGTTTVYFNTPTTRNGPQPIHIAALVKASK